MVKLDAKVPKTDLTKVKQGTRIYHKNNIGHMYSEFASNVLNILYYLYLKTRIARAVRTARTSSKF